MKFINLLFIALLLSGVAGAQGINIREEQVKMGKTTLWSFTATYDHTKDATVDAIEKKTDDAKLKRSSGKKGFSIYRAASWPAISGSKADYYYKAKGKKGKTILYFVVSKGYDNYVTSANDPEISANIKSFLQNLDMQISTNEQIKAREAELKQIADKNEALNKQLSDSKKAEEKKAQEIKTLQKQQEALPVK